MSFTSQLLLWRLKMQPSSEVVVLHFITFSRCPGPTFCFHYFLLLCPLVTNKFCSVPCLFPPQPPQALVWFQRLVCVLSFQGRSSVGLLSFFLQQLFTLSADALAPTSLSCGNIHSPEGVGGLGGAVLFLTLFFFFFFFFASSITECFTVTLHSNKTFAPHSFYALCDQRGQ